MNSDIHFTTLIGGERHALCGIRQSAMLEVHGPLAKRESITCEACKKKWDEGMRRVAAMFKNYRGEE